MSVPSIWDFSHYKPFLKDWIASRPHGGHGSKAAMARAARCQTAYISQVVLGKAHLSPEQGERLADFFGLLEEEKHFFLLLLLHDRAGTEELKRHFLKQLDALLRRRAQLKERVDKGTELTPEDQTTYFSSWVYPAVHLLTRMPEFSRAEAIAQRLDLPKKMVEEALRFLEKAHLVIRRADKIMAGPSRMHLPHDSPLVGRHHINWRMRAIQDLERAPEKNLHYSSVVTLSRKDVRALREKLLKNIELAKEMIAQSKDEALYSFCLDFFEV